MSEPRELTGRYLVELHLPSGRITGGYMVHHFVEFAGSCEEDGYPELATKIRGALARNDRVALRNIAASTDLQPEIVDDPDLYDEIDNNFLEVRPNYGIRLPRYSPVVRSWSSRRSGARAPRGRRVVRRSASRAGPARRTDDDPHEPELVRGALA